MANFVNPDQTALKDHLICVYNFCNLNTTFKTPSKRLIVPAQIVYFDMTAPEGK